MEPRTKDSKVTFANFIRATWSREVKSPSRRHRRDAAIFKSWTKKEEEEEKEPPHLNSEAATLIAAGAARI